MTSVALTICHMPQAPKLLLRGNPAEPLFVEAIESMLGLPLPTRPNSSTGNDPSLLWLSPTGSLVLGLKHDFGRMAGLLRDRLGGRSGDAIDVSDEYEHIRIGGSASADLMAAVCLIDVSLAAFSGASVARTLVAGVPAIVHRREGGSELELYVDRSYVHHLMSALRAQSAEFV